MENKAMYLMRCYNRRRGYRLRMYDERQQNIIKAIQLNEENFNNNTLLNFVCDYDDFDIGVQDYIKKYSSEQPKETPAPIIIDATHTGITADELKSEFASLKESTLDDFKAEIIKLKYELKQAQEHSQIGLLERTLAEVIVKTQGESIKNEIMGDFQAQAEKFIFENYGPITKKIDIEIGDRSVEFDEVLHEKFDTVLKFVQMNEPVFLSGQAGTGKNVLCKQVAKALDLDFYFTNAVTQEYKLTGFTDAQGFYHETQFYKAFKNGGLFMLDEMDASIPEVLIILNSAIANRYFDFPMGKDKDGNEIGGYTEAHPDFRVISAGNTFGLGADYDYVGRNQLDMASLDRFALVEIDYDLNIEKQVAEGETELVDFVEELRKTATDNGIRMVISYRSIGRIAKMQKLLPLAETLKTCLLKNLRKDDINTLTYSMDSGNKYVKCIRENLI